MQILCIIILIFFNVNIYSQEYQEKYKHVIEYWETKEFNELNLIQVMKELDMQKKDVVFKQAVLETGRFQSKSFHIGNNLFGMRKPGQRETTAQKHKLKGYATYKTWVHSVLDYRIWQGKKIITDYYSFLRQRKYASDKNYIKLLKTIYIKQEELDALNFTSKYSDKWFLSLTNYSR